MPTHIPSRQATEDESFRTIINEYRDFLSHQAMAPSSIESYLGRSRHFLIWLNRNGLGLSEVDGEVVVRFQAHDCTCFGRSCARPKHKRVTPHSLRHSCAMSTLKATGDIRKVSLWLGHASIQTTETYLRASPSEKLEILDAMQAPTIRKGAFGGVRDRLMALFDGL